MSSFFLHFPPFRLDLGNERLWCETVEIPLRPKTFAVLRYLLEHAEQLVTKEELFRAVWTDTVVGEDALTGCIRDLRKALGDEARQPRYIETVHRRGFRFIGQVVSRQPEDNKKPALSEVEGANDKSQQAKIEETEIETETEKTLPSDVGVVAEDLAFTTQDFVTLPLRTQDSSASWVTRIFVLAAGLLLTVTILIVQYLSHPLLSTQDSELRTQQTPQEQALPDKPSIAVLPFTNMSKDPDQEYFSDGLTDDLITDLSRIASLFVIARNSTFTYKGKPTKVQEIGRELGVRYVLEGSVQKAEGQIRINVQLVDALTGIHLWAEQYTRPFAELFALQDEIVHKIVTTLKLQLTLEEQGVLIRKRTDNVEAYDTYLRAMEALIRHTKDSLAEARQLWGKALTLDPKYAEVYAALGWSYCMEWNWRWSTDPRTLERAFTLAQQALALDESLPHAHALLSNYYALTRQYDQAIAEGEQTIILNPNQADAYASQAETLLWAGRPEEALRALKYAMRLNPRFPPWLLVLSGWAYRETGRYTEAIARDQEALSRSPNWPTIYLDLAANYLFQWRAQQNPAGQTLEPAVAAIQRALTLSESHYAAHLVAGYLALYQRQYDQALAKMEQGMTLAPTEAWSYAALAEVLSYVGRTEESVAAAAQALRLPSAPVDEHLAAVGGAYAMVERYEEARVSLQRYLTRYPNMLHAHLILAVVHSELGQVTEARQEAAEVLRLNPQFSLEIYRQRTPIKDPAVLERHVAALRRAGLK